MKVKYKKIFEKTFGKKIPIEKISINKFSPWDSVKHFELIGNIEKEFNIELKAIDIMQFKSFKDGIKILKKYNIII